MNRLRKIDPLQWLILSGLPLVLLLGLVSIAAVTLHNNSMRSMAGERDMRSAVALAGLLGQRMQSCGLGPRSTQADIVACLRDVNFIGLVQPMAENNRVIAYMVSPEARAVLHTIPAGVGEDVRMRPGVAEVIVGKQGVTYSVAEPVEHVIAYAPIALQGALSGYGVVLEEPWEDVVNPLMRYSLIAPVIALAALALSGLVVLLTMRAQARQQELRTYARALTEAQEAERARLARDLHDGTVQNLVVLNQRVQLLRMDAAKDAPGLVPKLDRLRDSTMLMIEDVRRVSHDLRPIYLDELGLAAALGKLAAEADAEGSQHTPPCAVSFSTNLGERRLRPDVELALFRIAQEAVTNALKHAAATGITLRLTEHPRHVELVVQDNGRGFDASLAGRGLGLINIRERSEFIGADVVIAGNAGSGTRVEVTCAGPPR